MATSAVRMISRLYIIPSSSFPTTLLPLQLSARATKNISRRNVSFCLQAQSVTFSAASRVGGRHGDAVKLRLNSVSGSLNMKNHYYSTSSPSKPPDLVTIKSTGIPPPAGGTNAPKFNEQVEPMSMWQQFLAPKPLPERYSVLWYREILLICTVFAITGSSTMLIVRPAVSKGLGIKGNFIDGPWSYRLCSIIIMTPIYASLLVGIGTIFGRHAYFRHFSVKIFSRFGIPSELMDPTFHETKKSFRKW